jgi:uncharacterized protein (TIGR00661 family)
MNFLFIIQGEGRGHMTQAMAFKDFLEKRDHLLTEVFVGRSKQREIPDFVYHYFSENIQRFHSPNFIRKKNRKGIQVFSSFLYNLLLGPLFIYEIIRLAFKIRKSNADIIINFYDMIGGLAHFFSFSGKKLICISHHYYYLHPSAVNISGNHMNKLFLRWHSKLTSLKAEKRIALSFQYLEDYPHSRLHIASPLLRKEVFQVKVEIGDNIVVYLLHEGFLDEVLAVAKLNPQFTFEVYTSLKHIGKLITANILLKEPDESFLKSLASSRGLICTAGFESVCEAAYFSKPILVWPSQGHFEQELNALDAVSAGLAESTDTVDMTAFFNFTGNRDNKTYREWVNKRDAILEDILFDQ